MDYPTVSSLHKEIYDIHGDSNYGVSKTIEYLNDAMTELASEISLPALRTSGTVTTSTTVSYVSLPTNFSHDLRRAYSTTNSCKLLVFDTLTDLIDYVYTPDQAGAVFAVTVEGGYLHYQWIPSAAETLKLWYNKVPTTMVSETDQPTELPVMHCRNILIHYVCKEVFDRIETDLSAQKVQTAFHQAKYEKCKRDLVKYIRNQIRGGYEIPSFLAR